MDTSPQPLTLPLSRSDCQQAQARAAAQCDREAFPSNRTIAHHIQYSTLAMLAARYYLKLLGIASEASKASLEWPGALIISTTAAPAQRLHCLPVISGQPLIYNDPSCQILPNCLGTLAVQIDLPQQEAQILGFLPSAQMPNLMPRPVSHQALHPQLPPLLPTSVLINRLSEAPITYLKHWLLGQVEAVWQPRSQLIQRLQPSFRSLPQPPAITEAALLHTIRHSDDDEQCWQAAEQLWMLNPTHPESPILSAKDLGLYLLGHSVTLLVGVLVKSNQQRLILIRLLPTAGTPYLPEGLSLTGHNSAGAAVFSVQSRQQDDYIQFKFTADVGDRFQLCIGWQAANVSEHFIV
jgi:hypothetical protein